MKNRGVQKKKEHKLLLGATSRLGVEAPVGMQVVRKIDYIHVRMNASTTNMVVSR